MKAILQYQRFNEGRPGSGCCQLAAWFLNQKESCCSSSERWLGLISVVVGNETWSGVVPKFLAISEMHENRGCFHQFSAELFGTNMT